MWQVLSEAKTEFEKYAQWVEKVKKNLEQMHKTLDEADTRTRAVNRKLRSVEEGYMTSQKTPLAETTTALVDGPDNQARP